jgi:hypothetical protein
MSKGYKLPLEAFKLIVFTRSKGIPCNRDLVQRLSTGKQKIAVRIRPAKLIDSEIIGL